MPIRVSLWRGDEQIGGDINAADPDLDTGLSASADAHVDRLITEVHRGDYGLGDYRIECDVVGRESGVFLGSYYRCQVTFPKKQQPASRVAAQ